jgi:hypothetical protein
MPRAHWLLQYERPIIEIVLASPGGNQVRTLLADTGAGPSNSPFDLILDESDCQVYGRKANSWVSLGGAYSGSYAVYVIRIEIPMIGFAGDVHAVGVPTTPPGLDGIACFRLLNRFTYGNFADPTRFGLEH